MPEVRSGHAESCVRFQFYVSGRFPSQLGPSSDPVDFALGSWRLQLVALASAVPLGFSHLIEASRADGPPASAEDVAAVRRAIFCITTLAAGNEVPVGPICGLDAQAEVRWFEAGHPARPRVVGCIGVAPNSSPELSPRWGKAGMDCVRPWRPTAASG